MKRARKGVVLWLTVMVITLMTMAVPAASISLRTLTLRVGESYMLTVKGTKKKAVWKSSKKKVATVSKKGIVKAKKTGSTKITAKVGKKTYTCRVKVKAAVRQAAGSGESASGGTGSSSGQSSAPAVSATGASASSGSAAATNKNTTPDPVDSTGLMGEELACYNTMMAYKATYPEGRTYTNADYYQWNGGIYRGGYGCAGFAFMLSDAYFGTKAAQMMKLPDYLGSIRTGDIIRLDYNTHSVMVLKVLSDSVIVAEANYNRSVHWGRKIPLAEIRVTGTNVLTRYNGPMLTMGQLKLMWATLPDLDGEGIVEEETVEQSAKITAQEPAQEPAPQPTPQPKEEPKAESQPAPQPTPQPKEEPKAESQPTPQPAPQPKEEPKAESQPAQPAPQPKEEPKTESQPAQPAPQPKEEPTTPAGASTEKAAETEKTAETEKAPETEQPSETEKAAETELPSETEKASETESSSETEKETQTEAGSETQAESEQTMTETEEAQSEVMSEALSEEMTEVLTEALTELEEKAEEEADEKADPEDSATITATLVIQWADQSGALDTRPGGVHVALVGESDGYAPSSGEYLFDSNAGFAPNGVQVCTADNGWTVSATVNKYKDGPDGKPAESAGVRMYSWLIEDVMGYNPVNYNPSAMQGGTDFQTVITLSLEAATQNLTSQSVNVVWEDEENAEGYRPAAVSMTLSDGQTLALTAENSWSGTIYDLPLYLESERINYNWVMDGVPYYYVKEVLVEGTQTTFTLTLTPPESFEKARLTIRYYLKGEKDKNGKRKKAFEDYVGLYEIGETYNVKSPALAGYEPSKNRVKGTITADTRINVYYTAKEYTLRVRYVYENGAQAAEDYVASVTTRDNYSVTSPAIAGYAASRSEVSGEMEGRDVEVTVYYTAIVPSTPQSAPQQAQPEAQPVQEEAPKVVEIEDYNTPLGLGTLVLNAGDCFE